MNKTILLAITAALVGSYIALRKRKYSQLTDDVKPILADKPVKHLTTLFSRAKRQHNQPETFE